MSGDQFAHPALAQVAAGAPMLVLQAAAVNTGMAPPLTALRYIDCSPAQINALAVEVQQGAGSVAAARMRFGTGRSVADQSWTGGAAEAFNATAGGLDSFYGAVQAAAEDTAETGATIAQRLDDLATSVANKTASIATQVYPASYPVAHGDRTTQHLQAVNQACAAIATLVQQADTEIPTIGAALANLTRPTPDSAAQAGPTASTG